MINNAGILHLGPFVDEDEASQARQVDINLHGPMNGTKLALQRMLPRGREHIVNVASSARKLAARNRDLHRHEARRRGLHGGGALGAARRGIDFSIVMPGVVRTEMIAGYKDVRCSGHRPRGRSRGNRRRARASASGCSSADARRALEGAHHPSAARARGGAAGYEGGPGDLGGRPLCPLRLRRTGRRQPHVILAIDQGTTGSTCIVFDEAAGRLGEACCEFEQHPAPRLGRARRERDLGGRSGRPRGARRRRDRRRRLVGHRHHEPARDGRRLGADVGRAAAPGALVWQDRRTPSARPAPRGGSEPLFRERTGLVLDPYFSAPRSSGS